MKNYIKYSILVSFLFFISGCGTSTVYIKPEYPTLISPRAVPEVKNTFVRKGCLWIDKHNTNLCGNDLRVVLIQIEKLRTNEKTCQAKITSYNEFVRKKKLQSDKYEIDHKK